MPISNSTFILQFWPSVSLGKLELNVINKMKLVSEIMLMLDTTFSLNFLLL